MARSEDQWVTIIAQLLKKAEKTDSEAEAATFFAQANELMLKHAIDEARVRDDQRKREGSKVETPVQVYWMYATHDAHAKAKEVLLEQVARSMHVRFSPLSNRAGSNRFREGNSGRYSQWGSFVGFAQDIENVKVAYTSLLIQWTRFVRTDVKNRRAEQRAEAERTQAWYRDNGYETYTVNVAKQEIAGEYGFRTGHLEGFAYRIGERMREQERAFLDMVNANALMVNKDAEISAWLKAQEKPSWYADLCLDWSRSKRRFCDLKKGHVEQGVKKHNHTIRAARSSSSRPTDSAGYYSGQAAGNLADLGGPAKVRG